ncbi:carbonic anhydrase [Paenibacillus sp. Aloe-11]|uniref:carbonic anhydrase n=1 Tax=Paenibacillus sp. Aloe-11 TaxID=1050222 RepID=UPI00024F072D|nr:carbonic anhydrase family protein [Paenibacillus sp. Aloe-11]EHS59702.1 carbonic anhydrase (carbonate dehydratase) [Paenibacillus sp. Aloe-11]
MKKNWKVCLSSVFSIFLVVWITGCTPQSTTSSTTNTSAPVADNVHAVVQESPHWSYKGNEGPEHWGELEKNFAACGNGQEQSPVNIEYTRLEASQTQQPIQAHYTNTKVSILNNGHTVQINAASPSNYIVLDGTKFTLKQFHFHHPSEHQIDGKNADMELHFVHQSDNGSTAVLGVLIQNGNENKAFSRIWSKLPTDVSKEAALEEEINLAALLPKDLHSIRYSGSLTTPPCTEHVNWIVLEQPIEMSADQISRFATLFPDNHRPVQQLGTRKLTTDHQ